MAFLGLLFAGLKARAAGSAVLSTLLSPPVLIVLGVAIIFAVGHHSGSTGAAATHAVAVAQSKADASAADLKLANDALTSERIDTAAIEDARKNLTAKVKAYEDQLAPGVCLLGDDGRRRLLDIGR